MTTINRETERLLWAQQALDDPQAQLERASADASFRSYWRSLSAGK
ncbi:MAG TPA: aminoglycoside phosphotransferase, partial [Arenimonas sp.]|nr:aminoglycoside phosphotransferase [Arenimonas sp.]